MPTVHCYVNHDIYHWLEDQPSENVAQAIANIVRKAYERDTKKGGKR